MWRNIFLFQTLAMTLSNGTLSACRKEWKPITPRPTLRSRMALYLALAMESGAVSMKLCSTLSRNRITSGMKFGSLCHSNQVSRFSEDRQQTAVRSSPCWSIPVGSVISEQRLEVFTSSPASFWCSGRARFT